MSATPKPVLLTHAAQLLTLRGDAAPRRGPHMRDLGIISDGAVLIENGKIAAVGTTDELLKNWVPQVRARLLGANLGIDELDCSGKVVLPGFVDSHTHPVFAAPRLIDFEKRIAGASYEEIAAAGGGIRASIRGVRESSADDLAQNVLSALNEMSRHGTTTVEAKSGYGLDLASELKSLEAIRKAAELWQGTVVPTLLAAHVVPPEHRANPDEYVRIVCDEMIPAVGGGPRFAPLFWALTWETMLWDNSPNTSTSSASAERSLPNNPFVSCAPPSPTASKPASTSAS